MRALLWARPVGNVVPRAAIPRPDAPSLQGLTSTSEMQRSVEAVEPQPVSRDRRDATFGRAPGGGRFDTHRDGHAVIGKYAKWWPRWV